MMAASITTKPHFMSETAHALFSGHFVSTGHDYETDGRRFLLIKSAEAEGPKSIQVVQNWFEELKNQKQ